MEKFSVANKSLIKDINTTAILQLVRERGPISRAEIAKVTKLNPATVSNNIVNLMELGIVREIGIGSSSGGRKPMMIQLNQDAYYVIGVDMGTTDVSTGITDLEGRILWRATLPFGNRTNPEEVLQVIKESIHRVLEVSGVQHDKLLGIGMGIHGLVDSDKGLSLFAPAFQWENVPIAEPFSEEFSLPAVIDNDVRAMALGEKWYGKAEGVSNFVFLNIGTGIGSGICIGGELIKGAHFGAGEIGHIHVAEGNERCFCGKTGCLSTLVSATAIERRVRAALSGGEASMIPGLVDGDESAITGEIIFQAALKGDALALRILDETGRHIGSAVSMVVNLLNPEMVLIGGGVANSGDFIFTGMKEVIQSQSMKNNIENIYIGPAGLGDDCGIVGAATLILSKIFSNPNQYK